MIRIYPARPYFDTKGLLEITHEPTGQVYILSCRNILVDLDRIESDLRAGKYPNRRLQRLWDSEPKFTARAQPMSIPDSKKTEKAIREAKGYLVIND